LLNLAPQTMNQHGKGTGREELEANSPSTRTRSRTDRGQHSAQDGGR
jgi:hypothetical protein